MAYPDNIGRSRLPELLDRADMKQAKFAEKMGITEGMVSRLISGSKKFSLARARQAAVLLECSIDDLYEWDDY